jgi:hypothetical protein
MGWERDQEREDARRRSHFLDHLEVVVVAADPFRAQDMVEGSHSLVKRAPISCAR